MSNKFIPNSFQLPNAIVDELLAKLSGNAFKCYALIARQTTGWHKQSDRISISQFMDKCGIKDRKTAFSCLSELEELSLINAFKKQGEITEFSLNFDLENADVEPVPKNGTSTKNSVEPVPKNGTSTSTKNWHSTKNTIKNNITNKNNTLTGITKSSAQKSVLAILHDFGIGGQLADDFITHRKACRAPITERAMNFLLRQAEIAGIPITLAVEIILAKGTWKSFQADYAWQSTAVALGWRVPMPANKNTRRNTSSEIDFDDMSIVGEPLRISEKTKRDLGL